MPGKTTSTLLIFSLFLIPKAISAQSLADSIDRLFAQWNIPDAPGCAAGVVRDGQLIYAKGFGLANLENKTPNTPSTIFYMCSVSKQFTGYAIALLAGEGKINLDEDIRTYLPWMSDFGGKKITVRNLVNHTSGIRDDIGLSQFYGLGIDGMLTQEQAIRILQKQHTLNFNPGEKFSYSNANYVLLAEIVSKVSGKSFSDYTDSAIFKPLGMTASKFVDDPSALIPNRASSYQKSGAVFHNAVQNVYTLGDGGLFTNVDDMAKWVSNFYAPKAGTLNDITLMTTPGKLSDGSNITYAMGIDVTTDRGYKRLIHNGGLAGYNTIIVIYPELKTGFFVFGNTGDREVTNKINDIAAMLIPDRNPKNNQSVPTAPTTQLPPAELSKWTGNYIADNGYKVNISYKEGKLYLNGNAELVPEEQNIFHLAARPAVVYHFSANPKAVSLVSPALARPLEMEYIKDVVLPVNELAKYAGNYWSDEVETAFTITLKDDKLWINDKYHAPVEVTLFGTDHLYTGYDFFSHLRIIRNNKGLIKGFELNTGGTTHLYFNKAITSLIPTAK